MKIVLQNVIWLLLFVAYNYLCLAENKNIDVTIGALFDEPNSQPETVLDSLLYFVNNRPKFRYKVKKHIIATKDSFKSSKILCNMLEEDEGVAVILGPLSVMTSSIIESTCSNKEIPNVQLTWRPTTPKTPSNTVVNMYPSADMLSQGLAVIVKNLQWRSFVILYESDEGLIRLQDVLKLQAGIVVKQLVNKDGDYRPLLKQIQSSGENKIILDCKTENILTILQQASDIKLMELYNSYFITSLDAHTIDYEQIETAANITTVRIIDQESKQFENALATWNQYIYYHQTESRIYELEKYAIKTETALMHDAINTFIQAVNSTLDTVETKSLNCQNEEDRWSEGLLISSVLRVNGLPYGVTGPIKFDEYGQRVNFTIHVVEGFRESVIAKWNAENPTGLEMVLSGDDSESALMKNMRKGVFIISSRLGPPYLMAREPAEGEVLVGNDRYEGYSMDLIAAIADVLKFKFEFKLAEDGKYGNYDKKSKAWNGLIKDLLERKADLAICDLTITHQRREVVDFSMPFMRLGISILYKKAEVKEINMFAFLDPFSIEVWIYTATLFLTLSLVLFLVSRMAPGDWENPHPCDQNPTELENIWDLKNCLWLTLGSIMCQGCDILPKGISSRMASSMWWFFSLIMTASYTANLAAFLTMAQMEPSIDSAEALAKQTKIKYGTVDGGATQTFFKDSNYSTFQRMWTSMAQGKPSVFEKNNGDGVKRVQTTRQRMYAFLMESSQIEYEIETKCDLKQVGNWLDSKGYGIAMPVDYPYRSAINRAILKLQEEGKLNELKEKWWKKKRSEPSCPKTSDDETSAELALANVGGVFLVLGIGVATAFFIAILEFLWNVRNVSVEEHISYWDAFKVEFLFALNVWVTKKRTKPQLSESSSSNSGEDSKSIAHSILQGAGSFLHLNMLTKIGTPDSKDT